jgi:hypothetical protein
MPAFETLPRFERDCKSLSPQQKAALSQIIAEAFVPDLATLPSRSTGLKHCSPPVPPRTPGKGSDGLAIGSQGRSACVESRACLAHRAGPPGRAARPARSATGRGAAQRPHDGTTIPYFIAP